MSRANAHGQGGVRQVMTIQEKLIPTHCQASKRSTDLTVVCEMRRTFRKSIPLPERSALRKPRHKGTDGGREFPDARRTGDVGATHPADGPDGPPLGHTFHSSAGTGRRANTNHANEPAVATATLRVRPQSRASNAAGPAAPDGLSAARVHHARDPFFLSGCSSRALPGSRPWTPEVTRRRGTRRRHEGPAASNGSSPTWCTLPSGRRGGTY